jgi:LysM repeat protein
MTLRAVLLGSWVLTGCGAADRGALATPLTPTLRPLPSPTPSTTPPGPRETVQPIPTLGPTPTPLTHIVQLNDTLLGIAAQYGLDLDDLLAANPGLNPRLLSVGQALVIPGPEGDPIGELIALPPPEPIDVSRPACFPQPGGTMTCLVLVTNPGDVPLEGVVLTLTSLDARGRAVESTSAVPALPVVPVVGAVPAAGSLHEVPGAGGAVIVHVESAYSSPGLAERSVPVDIRQTVHQPSEDRRRWDLAGELQLPQGPDSDPILFRVVAIGLDADGGPLGFATWEGQTGYGHSVMYRLFVFSLGGRMETVQVLAAAWVDLPPE